MNKEKGAKRVSTLREETWRGRRATFERDEPIWKAAGQEYGAQEG